MSQDANQPQPPAESAFVQLLSAVGTAAGAAAGGTPLLALLLRLIVLEAPALAIELVRLLSKPSASEADWAALEAKYRGKKAADFYTS